MLSMRETHSENDTSRLYGRSPARAGAGTARRARSAHRALRCVILSEARQGEVEGSYRKSRHKGATPPNAIPVWNV